jgi:hypothetical protein
LSWSFIALNKDLLFFFENGTFRTRSWTGSGRGQYWTETWARRKWALNDFLLRLGLRLLRSGRLEMDNISWFSVEIHDQLIKNGSSRLRTGTRRSYWSFFLLRTRLRSWTWLRSRTRLRARCFNGSADTSWSVQNLFDFALFINDAALLFILLGLLKSRERGSTISDWSFLTCRFGTRNFLTSWLGTRSFRTSNRSGNWTGSGDASDWRLNKFVFKRSFFNWNGTWIAWIAGLISEFTTSAIFL